MQQQKACHTGQKENIFLRHPGLSFTGSHENPENQQMAEYDTNSLANDGSPLSGVVLPTQAIPTNGHFQNDHVFRGDEVAQYDRCPPVIGSPSRSEDRQLGAPSCKQCVSSEQETGSSYFPSVREGVPQIDPTGATFPSVLDGMSQIDPASADFPSFLDGMSQIDPASADFPSIWNGIGMSQVDSTEATFPSVLDGMSQIDSASADFPSVLDRVPQIDPTTADFPSFFDGMSQIDSTCADLPSVLDRVPQIDSTGADFPSFLDGMSQIAPAE